jgi:hypothetical protein
VRTIVFTAWVVLMLSRPAHAFVDRLPNMKVCASERVREQRKTYRRVWLGVSGLTTIFAGTTGIDPVSKKSEAPALATFAYITGFAGLFGALGWDDDIKVCGYLAGQEPFSPSPGMLNRREFLGEHASFEEFYRDDRRGYLSTQIMLGVLATSSALMIPAAPTRGNQIAAGVFATLPLVSIGLNYLELRRKRELYSPQSGWTLQALPHDKGLNVAFGLSFD